MIKNRLNGHIELNLLRCVKEGSSCSILEYMGKLNHKSGILLKFSS